MLGIVINGTGTVLSQFLENRLGRRKLLLGFGVLTILSMAAFTVFELISNVTSGSWCDLTSLQMFD